LDAANLVLDATAAGHLPTAVLSGLDNAVLDSYLHGCKETGWRGTDALVRLGHDLTAALRFGLDAPELIVLARDPARQNALQQRDDRPVAQIIAYRAAVVRHASRLAERARALLDTSPPHAGRTPPHI
jgi:hypothetical protein